MPDDKVVQVREEAERLARVKVEAAEVHATELAREI